MVIKIKLLIHFNWLNDNHHLGAEWAEKDVPQN